ncbi:MAG: ATP-binding protein, partial [Nitrospinae bacterium]|nr:ATP-binding protein [Nitrospinota bacterium]
FDVNKNKTVCIDEIQRRPGLFQVLRSIIDRDRRNGQLLILGSASPDLIRQSSESLAGRISYIELTPFTFTEVNQTLTVDLFSSWFHGGFPDSVLVDDQEIAYRWRENYIRSFIERDIPQLGKNINSTILQQLLVMLSHNQGQLLNCSKLAASLGVSHNSIRNYVELFEHAYIVRLLRPYFCNVKKRLVRSPKVYVRDSGLLHTLLGISDFNGLMGNPVYGFSWEGFVIENILCELPDWKSSFYRTSNEAEIDLIIEKGGKKIAIECKASKAPIISKGFWNSLEDIDVDEAYIIAPVDSPYPVKQGVTVVNVQNFLKSIK